MAEVSPDLLNVALVVPRTEAEGPGARTAIWVQGCPFRCKGCCNPEMLAFEQREATSVDALLKTVRGADVEGVTFLGGEPFAQAKGLAALATRVQEDGRTVMVFSGFTRAELEETDDAGTAALLAHTDLLVDGRYDASQRTLARRWVGSDNQVMHFLTDRYQPDDPRFAASNTIELRMKNGHITLNGWPVDGAKTRIG